MSEEANENPCLWKPIEIIDLGQDCQAGIAIDDHCFVVLTKNIVGSWALSEWIPRNFAIRLGELAKSNLVL